MKGLDSETALIGCLLLEPKECCSEVFSEITAEMFFSDECREVFEVCQKAYFEKNGAYDIATISSRLNPELRTVALRYAETLPSVSNWKLYMNSVKDSYTTRTVVNRANEMVNAALTTSVSIADLQEMAESILVPFNGVKEAESTNAKSAVTLFEQNQKSQPEYFKFGLPDLDDCSYVERGDLIVIGGRPSAGKTAISLNFMLRMAMKHKCVFFSFETSEAKVVDRMVAAYAGIPLAHIKKRCLTDEDKKRWNECKARFALLDFEIVPSAGKTVQWVRNEAVRRGAEVVFVDYLTIVKSHGQGRYELTTNAINDLHVMAQNEKIVTIVLAQINRQGAQQPPTLADLKESGGIEEASDVIILLHNGYEDGYKVILGKNKEGRVGSIDCVFNAETQQIRQLGVDEDGFEDCSGQQLPF
jgi:replicative DNA helicase